MEALSELIKEHGLNVAFIIAFAIAICILWRYYTKRMEKAEERYDKLNEEYREEVKQLNHEKETLSKQCTDIMDTVIRSMARQGGNGDRRES